MKNVLNLQLLNGDIIKYQDKSEIKAKLLSNDKKDFSGLPAEFILKRNNEIYLREKTTVGEDNIVSVVIDRMPKPRTYIVEVAVDEKYYFPSDNKVKLIVERSSAESAEVPPKEQERVSDLIKKELSELDLPEASTGDGGIRTDIAYCKRIGKPLGEKIEVAVDEMRSGDFKLESGKTYQLNYELSQSAQSQGYAIDTILINSFRGYETREFLSDYMSYDKETNHIIINHPTEEVVHVRFRGIKDFFDTFELYPVDLEGDTTFNGFTTQKAYDDLTYPYVGFRQTTDEEVSQIPKEYNWVRLG